MPTKPTTPQEWRLHAEDLHNQGLQIIDRLVSQADMPTNVSIAGSTAARAFFGAAQSAIAIATFVGNRP